MAKIPDGTFTTWHDTETIKAVDYNRERELLRIATNDNDTRLSSLEISTEGIKLGTAQLQKITADDGGVKIDVNRIGDTQGDVLAEVLTAGKGFHTLYASSGTKNLPPSNISIRGYAHITDVNPAFGYVKVIDFKGVEYSNYIDNGKWLGWKTTDYIESGSNTNGTYIKFPDGTQICHYHIVPTDQAINVPYGSLFTGTRTWTFPAPFVNVTPTVTCPQFNWGTGGGWGTVDGQDLTTATLRGIDVASRPTGTVCDISAIAIGRWK
jgi:hypothetical protein